MVSFQVNPTDSLAGVALKYGISMADLRKANMLWTSDPIHLRKILYIPLDKSSKAKELVLSQLESTSTDTLSSESNLARSSASIATDNAIALSSSSSLTIRRIPVSQLSFFPPPSSSIHPSSTIVSSRTMPRSGQTYKPRNPIPFEVAPSCPAESSYSSPGTSAFASALQSPPPPTPPRAPKPSLTSLFSALPIGRISFDSNTSTPSQASEDQEHELDDVSRSSPPQGRQKPREQGYLGLDSSSLRAPVRPPQRQIDTVELSPFPALNYSSQTNGTKVSATRRSPRVMHYTSPDLNLENSEVIQTAQPKPSPVMQLPLMSKRDP
jgi:LysM repeat protein